MVTKEIHGAVSRRKEWRHCRWCPVHKQYHGSLYPCIFFDEETLSEIAKQSDVWKQNLNDKDWVLEQIRHGTPPEGIEIMKFFVGQREG